MSTQSLNSVDSGDDSLNAIFDSTDVTKFNVIPSDQKRHYAVYYGPITREDGVEDAIKLALMAQVKLVIIGKPDPENQHYFEYVFYPGLREDWRLCNIEYLSISALSHQKLNKLLGEALVMINPTSRNDCSGIECLQANACGTPVFSNPKGIMEHIITPGANGHFGIMTAGIEKYQRHALEHIQLCVGIEPEWCRRQAEEVCRNVTIIGKTVDTKSQNKSALAKTA